MRLVEGHRALELRRADAGVDLRRFDAGVTEDYERKERTSFSTTGAKSVTVE
jgi:hypothetical protein